MSYQSDTTLGQAEDSNARTRVLDVMNESKAGYSLMSFVQCVHPACRIPSLQRTMWQGVGRASGTDPTRRPSGFSLGTMSCATRSESLARFFFGFNYPRDPPRTALRVAIFVATPRSVDSCLPQSRVSSTQRSFHHRCGQNVHFPHSPHRLRVDQVKRLRSVVDWIRLEIGLGTAHVELRKCGKLSQWFGGRLKLVAGHASVARRVNPAWFVLRSRRRDSVRTPTLRAHLNTLKGHVEWSP